MCWHRMWPRRRWQLWWSGLKAEGGVMVVVDEIEQRGQVLVVENGAMVVVEC